MIKTFIKANKLTIGVILASFLLYGIISLFSEGVTKPPEDPNAPKKVVVPVEGQKLYDLKGEVVSPYDQKKSISYSLLFPANVVRETKLGGQETIFYYAGQRVAVLNFYHFPKKISSIDFAMNVLGQKYVLAVDKTENAFNKVPYITASGENSYYRIASFKDGEWIGMVEMLVGNATLEKQLLESLQVR